MNKSILCSNAFSTQWNVFYSNKLIIETYIYNTTSLHVNDQKLLDLFIRPGTKRSGAKKPGVKRAGVK